MSAAPERAGEPGLLPAHQPNCLGCGPANPAGLGIRMRADGDGVAGEVTFRRAHEGAPGFVHGGAVATALDDALGMLLFRLERPAVTARLEVDYRRPVFIERPYRLRASADRVEGRKLHLRAALLDAGDGEPVAEAEALFVVVDAEHFLQGDRAGRSLPW